MHQSMDFTFHLIFDTKFSLCYKFLTENEKNLLAGYAGGELVCRQAEMILGWGELEINKEKRFLLLIKLWVCCDLLFPSLTFLLIKTNG